MPCLHARLPARLLARALCTASAAVGVAAAPGAVVAQQTRQDADTQAVLQRINTLRASGATCGQQRLTAAPPLQWNALLERAATRHAQDMARQRRMSHAGSDGASLSERVGREAYPWAAVGENVAAGQESASEALEAWMASPGHCSNLMSTRYTELGLGAARAPGDTQGWYRALVLASPLR
jgi:uncharacterized protein YkwD